MTQAQLAETVDANERTIGLLERGEVWPEYERLESIAKALNIPLPALFDAEPTRVQPTPQEALDVLAKAIQAKPAAPQLDIADFSPKEIEVLKTAINGIRKNREPIPTSAVNVSKLSDKLKGKRRDSL